MNEVLEEQEREINKTMDESLEEQDEISENVLEIKESSKETKWKEESPEEISQEHMK